MHTIRIKELKGRSWEQIVETIAFNDKEEARLFFTKQVTHFANNVKPPISITWSEGKKVLGVYRVS